MLATPSRFTLAALALAIAAAVMAQGDYEGLRTFKASEVLPPALVKGPQFQVGADAKTEGYFHEFTLSSDFGSFSVEGKSMLVVRVQEVDALAKLAEVSKTEVFLKAAGTSVVNVGKGVAATVKDPEATAKGVGGGVKRFGQNLGRKAKKAGEDATEAAKKDRRRERPNRRSPLGRWLRRRARPWSMPLSVSTPACAAGPRRSGPTRTRRMPCSGRPSRMSREWTRPAGSRRRSSCPFPR